MATSFQQRFFPDSEELEWEDWHWQLRNAFRSKEQLKRVITLSCEEERAFSMSARPFPVAITPYYMSVMDLADPDDALRKTVVPSSREHVRGPGEFWDPLGESDHMPVPRIVHTYPSKVLFLVTDFCATYCRYCTRARVVGSGELKTVEDEWTSGLDYISGDSRIRDVLLSGGDPLTLSDGRLDWILSRLKSIPHVEIVRLGTKLPAVLPQRITPELVSVLDQHSPIWMSVHFTHPRELTNAVEQACDRLARAGIPVVSQTVLLQGVNDRTEILQALFEGLVRLRVRPYYLHQCDPIIGSAHFRTPVARGQDIIRNLHGRTTGFAIPMYMLDAPGGGGKVPIGPEFIEGREGDELLLRNYEGRQYRYHDAV